MASMSNPAPELSPVEQHRLLANLLRIGRIEQVQATSPARCRVRTGDLLTTWVPWMTLAAGGNQQTRHWRSPAMGEVCLLLAPGGDLAQAVALPGLFSEDMPQGAASEDVERHDFSSTDFWEHRRSAGTLHIDIASVFEVKVGASVLRITPSGTTLATPDFKVDSPKSTFTGAVTVQGLLTYQAGISGSAGGGGGGNSISGGIRIDGGSLTHNGVNVGSSHTHPGDSGGSTGGPR